MKLIVINGAPRSGKDTFVNICKDILGERCKNISIIDFVKDIAKICGWNGEKTEKNRKFLSDLKDLLTDWSDLPYVKVNERILKYVNDYKGNDELIIFLHIREPHEMYRYKAEKGALTLVIRRFSAEGIITSNHSDRDVLNFSYDYEIFNNGSLDDLKEKALKFLHELGVL